MYRLLGWSAVADRRLVVSLTISAILHAVIVSSLNGRRGADTPMHASLFTASVLQVALVNPTRMSDHSLSLQKLQSDPSAQTHDTGMLEVLTQGADVPANKKHVSNQVDKSTRFHSAKTSSSATSRVNASRDELVFDAGYLKSSEIDTAPFPLEEITPEYPDHAGIQEGYVVVKLLIGDRGKVDVVEVLEAFPKDLFEASARDAFLGKMFSPGLLKGVPVKTQMIVRVRFSPEEQASALNAHGYVAK